MYFVEVVKTGQWIQFETRSKALAFVEYQMSRLSHGTINLSRPNQYIFHEIYWR